MTSDDAELRGEHWHVPFEVENLGDETVEEIVVVVELLQGEETVAEAETTIALLGENERVHAVAVFENDPRPYTGEGRARSVPDRGRPVGSFARSGIPRRPPRRPEVRLQRPSRASRWRLPSRTVGRADGPQGSRYAMTRSMRAPSARRRSSMRS